MSRVRKELSVVQFQVETRQASASMDALRERAKKLNEDIATTNASIKALGDVPPDDAGLVAFQKTLKGLKSDLNDVTRAQNELMKGVKAADKLWKAAATGTMESLSMKEIKAGQRGMQARMQNLQPNKENEAMLRAMKAAIEEGEIAMRRFDADVDNLMKTISEGGAVSSSALTKAKNDLNGLLDIIPRGTEEWNQYNKQLQGVTKYINSLSETERRLAGEIVTVDDAIKMSAALSKEAAEIRATNAKEHLDNERKELATVQENLELSKNKIATTERELAATKEKMAAQQELVGSIRALEDAEDKAEAKTSAAETALRQARGEQQKFGDVAWEAAKKVGELEKKLEELNKEPVKPKVDISELRGKLESAKKEVERWMDNTGFNPTFYKGRETPDAEIAYEQSRIAEYRQRIASVGDVLGKRRELLALGQRKSGLKQAEYNYFKAEKEAIDYVEKVKSQSATIQEQFKGFDLSKLFNSENVAEFYHTLKDISQQIKAMDANAVDSKVAEWIEQQLNQINQLKDAYQEARQKAGQLKKNSELYLNSTQDNSTVSDNESYIRSSEKRIAELEKLKAAQQEVAQLEKQIAESEQSSTQVTQSSNEVDKQKAELQQQLADAQQKLSDAKQAAEGPTRKLKEAEKNLADAQSEEKQATEALAKARGNMNVADEEQKLDALERQHDDLTESLSKQKQAETELAQAAVDARQNEKEAAIELAQAQNMTQEQVENAIAVLEKQQKKTADGTEEYDQQAESLTRLRERLAEMKGEWMSLADAQRLAGEAGTKAFIASPEQLQKATAAIERRKKQLQETIQLQRRSGAATDAEEKELKELEVQLKKLKMEQDNFNMSHSRMDALLKQPTNAKNLDELRAAIKRAKAELNSMEDSLGKNSKAYKDMAANTKKAEIQLKEMESQAKGTLSAFDKAWSRLKTYVGLYVGAAVAMQKLTQTMGDLMELSDKMGEVRKTTGFSADEVGRLSDNLSKLDTRTPLTQLMELSSLAGSVGLKTQQDVQGFTEAANQLIVALPEMGNESARTLIKIATATGDLEKNNNDVRETLEKVGSTIIALRANSASAAGPITDFVSRVGAVGAQAGISIDQIAALGSTIDALGGRVEMSATALSRMIPAIRNNSFAIANSIGVTEKYLKSLAPMQQMVLIFQKMRDNIQHIDTSTEEGMNAMADNVEAMLGKNATMREVMKDLEQQGARAGIVFGLLSQNVGELQRQLGIASDAYEKNTALMNEYNNMNETAAAKWEKLKNAMEEWFVKDSWQRTLGAIIDGLRRIVDLLSGDNTINSFFRGVLVYLALLKGKWTQTIGSALISTRNFILSMRASTIAAEANTAAQTTNAVAITATGNAAAETTAKTNLFTKAWGKMNAAMKANVVAALAGLFIWLGKVLWDSHKAAHAAEEAYARLNQQINEEKAAVDRLFRPLKNDNLEHAEKVRLINAINSQYGSYLGKMLTEASNAHEIERAYRAINMQLEKKSLLEGIEANKKRVQEQQSGRLDSAFSEMDKAVAKASKTTTDASAISAFIAGAVKDALEQGLSPEQMRKNIQSQLKKEISEGTMKEYVQIISGGMSRREESDRYIAHAAVLYYNAQKKVQDDATEANKRLQADLDNLINNAREVADADIPELIADYNKALSKGNDASKYTAKESNAVVEAFDAIKAYYDLHHDELSDEQKKRINAALDLDMSKFRTKASTDNAVHGPNPSPNPYGTYNRITDSYDKWDADTLVNRRKEMLERVRALANGADVQAVLSEDAKFISEATRKNIKTTRDAIEWYNTERLKIQDALHEKHLTNTGDWMDPKKGAKRASKMVQDEIKYYLDELDAYYTERKAKIQEAQNDGEISEAEGWRRTLQNEAEWQQRRAELQQLYSKKRKDVAQDERDAIYNIISERTGDTISYIQSNMASTVNFIEKIGVEKGKPAMDRIYGDIELGMERSFLRQRNAVGKQMDAIRDIIEKERPFNGITENLEQNLTKMGVLYGDMDDELERLRKAGEDVSEFNAKQREEGLRRIAFLLQEAEHAYNTNIEEVMQRMAEKGMTVWAEYLSKSPKAQDALMAQLHTTFDKVQEAIKKEASLWKKEAENMWNNILLPDGQTTLKQLADRTVAALSLDESRTKRANSLINAGQASERVADRLAIQQMKVQLAMQEHYYNIMHERGKATIDDMERQAAAARERHNIEEATRFELDAQHARMTLNLATTKEETELAKQREEIIARTEESQNRLYTELKAWADLISSSLQNVFEASHAGDAEYYNERAKLNLTGKGGPGAGTYIVIEDEGTSDARAHYEYLNEREALERQREIENQNAVAEAFEKMWDDINMKLSETITDQMNAMLQNQSIDANTQAVIANTEALYETAGGSGRTAAYGETKGEGRWTKNEGRWTKDEGRWTMNDGMVAAGGSGRTAAYGEGGGEWLSPIAPQGGEPGADYMAPWTEWAEASNKATETMVGNNKKVEQSTQSAFARMTMAANMYGIAYQAMSNENLNTTQKFSMMALQAVGNYAIGALTAEMASASAKAATDSPGVLGTLWKQLGWAAAPVFAIFTGLLGGLMGLATSKITKAKGQIAQVTGAGHVSAGRLSTGMLQYAEGNVNEFTDPSSLREGQTYQVDAANGKTYKARYMGKGAKTHITNGPEFHLVGEEGREAIIDAKTTRHIRFNEPEVWRYIQTLYNGGSLSHLPRRRGRGVAAFADGNLDEMGSGGTAAYGESGMSPEQIMAMQASLDRNSEVLERALTEGIKGVFDVYGKGGLVDSYDTGKKTVKRHGERY